MGEMGMVRGTASGRALEPPSPEKRGSKKPEQPKRERESKGRPGRKGSPVPGAAGGPRPNLCRGTGEQRGFVPGRHASAAEGRGVSGPAAHRAALVPPYKRGRWPEEGRGGCRDKGTATGPGDGRMSCPARGTKLGWEPRRCFAARGWDGDVGPGLCKAPVPSCRAALGHVRQQHTQRNGEGFAV